MIKIGLAPMEGVLDPLMRQIITKHSQVDHCTTEFIRVTDKKIPDHVFFRYAPELENSSLTSSKVPVLIQLLGGKSEWMSLNAKRAYELGAYGIDINFGCPAKTVNKHDGGATLLKNPERLYQTIIAIKSELPENFHVSAKVRLGFHDKTKVLEISQACSEAKATWLTVHARTKDEGYKPPAHWRFINDMKSVSKIPIFANGDIWSLKDYKECKKASGCENVMIGRGLLRNPYLAEEIKTETVLDALERSKKTVGLIHEYSQLGHPLYGEFKALNRVKQWLRLCTQPKQTFFNELFNKAKRFSSMNEMKALLVEYQNSESSI